MPLTPLEELQIVPYDGRSVAQSSEAPAIPPTSQETQAAVAGRLRLQDGSDGADPKQNLGSVEPPWGHFVRVPLAPVVFNLVAVALQFTVYLTAVGLVESDEEHVKRSNMFVRGLPSILVPGWSVAICATVGEFLGRQMSLLEGFCSMLLFTACCAVLAAAPWYDLGFAVQVVGGVLLHTAIICVYVGVRRGNRGRAMKDSIYGLTYFFALFTIVHVLFLWGLAICIFWPILDEKAREYSNDFEQPQRGLVSIASGVALALACNVGEGGAVIVMTRLDKHFYKRVPNSRTMGSWVIMFIHSVSESFRLATLWYSAILHPESSTWISALVSSLVLNTSSRTGWQDYTAWRLTCKDTFWVPGCWTFVHREARFAFGYCRFGAPLAAFGARYVLSFVSKSESLCCTSEIKPYFNDTVLRVMIGSLISELLEDFAVLLCEWCRIVPSWYTDKTVRAFSFRVNERDPYDARAAMWVSATPTTKPVHKVHRREKNFSSRFVHLGITNAATFLVYTGLICLVSLDFFLGFSGERVDAIGSGSVDDMARNGGLLWRLPGE